MISNLPRDVIEEILSRVPVTSLRRLRSTCKRWYHDAIFKDTSFIKKHFDKTERQYYDVMLMDFRVYSVSSILNGIDVNSVRLLEGKHSLIDPLSDSEAYMSQAFHCDGLLLCNIVSSRYGSRRVVWNPFSGQTRWFEPTEQYQNTSEVYALGYNNKELCHSYKILRLTDEKGYQKLEIYEFSSDSWRNLDVSPLGLLVSSGVSLKGNTYWVFMRYGVINDYSLLSFDYSTERFQHLCVPYHRQEVAVENTMALSVVREEYLSLFLYQGRKTCRIEIWITKEIDPTFVSWSKFLTVDLKPHMIRQLMDPISFFIDEENKVAFYCERDEDTINTLYMVGEVECKKAFRFYELDIKCIDCWPTVFTYVPRLVV